MIECLISLAIAAMLLTAVAAAFSSSAAAIRINDDFAAASQAARVSLEQMLREIRRCNAVTGISADGRQITLTTWNDKDITYKFDPSLSPPSLLLVTNDDLTDPNYTLARNVAQVQFSADARTEQGGISRIVRVSVTIMVEVGENQVRLTGSAAPRRALSY